MKFGHLEGVPQPQLGDLNQPILEKGLNPTLTDEHWTLFDKGFQIPFQIPARDVI